MSRSLCIKPRLFPWAQEVPVIKLGELDSEQQFVGTDGWYGEADMVIHQEGSNIPMMFGIGLHDHNLYINIHMYI